MKQNKYQKKKKKTCWDFDKDMYNLEINLGRTDP